MLPYRIWYLGAVLAQGDALLPWTKPNKNTRSRSARTHNTQFFFFTFALVWYSTYIPGAHHLFGRLAFIKLPFFSVLFLSEHSGSTTACLVESCCGQGYQRLLSVMSQWENQQQRDFSVPCCCWFSHKVLHIKNEVCRFFVSYPSARAAGLAVIPVHMHILHIYSADMSLQDNPIQANTDTGTVHVHLIIL